MIAPGVNGGRDDGPPDVGPFGSRSRGDDAEQGGDTVATREELADALAGFALFADLSAPQLLSVAGSFEEVAFAEGERILRQGLTGSGFYVILDGTAEVRIDGTARSTLHRGDFFGEVSILLGEPPTADIVAPLAARLPAPRSRGGVPVPARAPAGHVPDAPGPGAPPAQRQPLAELTVAADQADRPFPPGEYPVLVIGSGPGGLQLSYGLRKFGVPHAVISADPGPGGMFRRWPFFQRLLSWTKPYAPAEKSSREYQRYDWNSLIADEPELRALQAEFLDGSSYFPSRPEMQANLEAFATRAGIAVRYGTRWERTRREEGPDGTKFVVETTDGEYRCRYLVLAVGVAEPSSPVTPGIELANHYAETREASTYAGQARVHHRQAELGVRARFRPRVMGVLDRRLFADAGQDQRPDEVARRGAGPRTSSRSRTASWASGCGCWTRRSPGLSAVEGGIRVDLRRTDNGDAMFVVADDVIAATGFTCPLLDLPDLGVATFGASKLPAVTPFWESSTVPGIYFAGTIGQAAPGLRRHGIPANSGAVHGARYNALILAQHIAEKRFGVVVDRPLVVAVRADPVPAPRGDVRARAVAPEGVPGAGRDGDGRRRAA